MKTLKKEQWQKYVAQSSLESYSFVCCYAILRLWEAGVKTKDEAHLKLSEMKLGITGFQADNIIAKALGNKPDWEIDEDLT